jgi:hypothetical protein
MYNMHCGRAHLLHLIDSYSLYRIKRKLYLFARTLRRPLVASRAQRQHALMGDAQSLVGRGGANLMLTQSDSGMDEQVAQ